MRSIFILLCVSLATAFTSKSFAQERTPKTPDERATVLTDWMKSNLQLTPEQEALVQSVNLKYANLNEQLRGNSLSRLQKAKKLKANDQAKDKELKAILTDEQFELYQSKKDEVRQKFKEEAQERRAAQ